MTQTPDLPPNHRPVVLWAPRLRHRLAQFFQAMDRRKARKLAAANVNLAVHQWRLNYDLWWVEHGWAQGAPTADQVLANRPRP